MFKKFTPLFFSIYFLIFLFFLIFLVKKNGYGFTYQSTISMPKGVYFLTPIHEIHRYDVIIFRPPLRFLNFAERHHWMPKSGLLMKYVMAIPGDYVCKGNYWVWINHRKIAKIYRYYAPHKLLPSQPFCGILKKNQYLLMSTRVSHSFDGRYFGPINRKKLISKANYLILL